MQFIGEWKPFSFFFFEAEEEKSNKQFRHAEISGTTLDFN